MRRKHWWGAAVGVGVLAVAATSVPMAYAANRGPAPKKHVVASHHGPVRGAPVSAKGHGRGDDDDHHGGHGGHGGGGHCPYPPHGKPDVAISVINRAHRSQPIVISGSMKVNGCGYDQYAAGLYALVKGNRHRHDQWVQVNSTTTGKGGVFSFTVMPKGAQVYRVMTAGGGGLAQAWSDSRTIEQTTHRH